MLLVLEVGGVLAGTILLGYTIERSCGFRGAINTGWLWS